MPGWSDHEAALFESPASRWLVRLSLSLLPLLAIALVLTTLPLLHVAQNRLVPGTPLFARAALGLWLWPILALSAAGCAFLTSDTKRLVSSSLFASALFLGAIGLGDIADTTAASLPAAGRVRLASGTYLLAMVFIGTIAPVKRQSPRWLTGAVVLGFSMLLLACGSMGAFDALSIVVEYRARREALLGAVLEHVLLTFGALLVAIAVVAVGYPWRRTRSAFEQIAAGLQVVPAVALLGVLVAGLSTLLAAAPILREFGLTALGSAPAIGGIAAYLLLPLWRGLRAGLSAAEPASIEAGEALGMTRAQIVSRVRLPQGIALLIGALRVATVQSVGLATLGALVGAGGLGRIVFDGMAQYAPDLILLGALPIALLAWGADSALAALETYLRQP